MTKYIWTNFGKLTRISKTSSLVLIENDNGQVLKMSLNKYRESAISVFEKAQQFQNKQIVVRTSQITGNWSTSEWFSDLKLGDDFKQSNTNNEPLKIEAKARCLNCDGKGFYLFAGGSKRNQCSNCEGTGIRPEFREKKSMTTSPPEINNTSQFLSDHSNSYVQGDLGHINTKYWNGY